MAEREKVIKGLECCEHTDGAECKNCPYDNKDEDCTALMSMDALELMKEQEDDYKNILSDYEELAREHEKLLKEQGSMSPEDVVVEERKIIEGETDDGIVFSKDLFYHCPSCKVILSRTHKNKDIMFCPRCGKKVKWE